LALPGLWAVGPAGPVGCWPCRACGLLALPGLWAVCPAGRAFFLARQKEAKRRFKRNRMVSLKDLFL